MPPLPRGKPGPESVIVTNPVKTVDNGDGSFGYVLREELNESLPSNLYYALDATISGSTNYTVPFSGRNLIFYASKAIVLRLNSLANDPIALPAKIGLKVDGMVITSLHLSSVLANTDISIIVTGR